MESAPSQQEVVAHAHPGSPGSIGHARHYWRNRDGAIRLHDFLTVVRGSGLGLAHAFIF